MAGVGTYRRYLLRKEAAAWARQEDGIALGWLGRRREITGTDLPPTFPALAKLAAATPEYTVVEDLKGPTPEQSTDVAELVEAGLSRKEAAAVIAALEEL